MSLEGFYERRVSVFIVMGWDEIIWQQLLVLHCVRIKFILVFVLQLYIVAKWR